MRLIDADAIHYDRLLKTDNKHNPLEWAASQESIDATPTIDPVKHGKWLAIDNTWLVACECGYITNRYNISNYCPNCGANMRDDEYEDIPMEYYENGGI